jgi:preprotein translocase subunit SecG
MVTLVTVVHVLAAVFLILIVLLQSGKGASLGASFGGASQTVFGASGATSFLTKLTAASAIIFMITSLTLAYFSTRSESSLARAAKSAPAASQPVEPGMTPAAPAAAVPAPQAPAPEAPKPEPEQKK